MPFLDVLCLLVAALVGFAVHRASLCNVRAVAELLAGERPRMLASLFVAVFWSATVAGTLIVALHWPVASLPQRRPLSFAVAGGFVFGLGAAVNGGCSLSTLQRLADGELAMLATLSGLALGLLAWTGLEARGLPTALVGIATPWEGMPAAAKIALVAFWAWALQEAVRLWRGTPPLAWSERLRAPKYRLSTAAALLGMGGAVLYALQGSWTYTNVLRNQVAWALGMTPSMAGKTMLAIALVGGMVASSLQRRSFALRVPRRSQALACLSGGVLMGLGAALLPGGNDTLLLTALPSLSASAFASYAALLAGIAAALLLVRTTTRRAASANRQ